VLNDARRGQHPDLGFHELSSHSDRVDYSPNGTRSPRFGRRRSPLHSDLREMRACDPQARRAMCWRNWLPSISWSRSHVKL
jgi:hypothetical protein